MSMLISIASARHFEVVVPELGWKLSSTSFTLLQQSDLFKDSSIRGFLSFFTERSLWFEAVVAAISGHVQNSFGNCLSCFTSRMVPTEFMLFDWFNISRVGGWRFPRKAWVSPSSFLTGCSVNSTLPGNNLVFNFKSFRNCSEFSSAWSVLWGKNSFVIFLNTGLFNSGGGTLVVNSLLWLFRWTGSLPSILLGNSVWWLKLSDAGIQFLSGMLLLLTVPKLPSWGCSSSSSSLLSPPCISPYRFMYFLVAKDILLGEIKLRPTMLLSVFVCRMSWKEKSEGGFWPEWLRDSRDNWCSLRYFSAMAFASMLRSTTLGHMLTLASDMEFNPGTTASGLMHAKMLK